MKSIAVSFLFFATSAFAADYCNGNFEAQFIARATNVKQSATGMTFQLKDIRHFEINPLCPLEDQEALSAEIETENDKLIEGSEVSGVLVYDTGSNTYRVE